MDIQLLSPPATTTAIPNGAVLASFDIEANNARDDKQAVAGSAVALGGSAYLWPEGRRVPQPLRESTFYRAINPAIAANPMGGAFFAKHPHALAATRREPKDPHFAALSFVHWLTHMMRNHNRPLGLLSNPHPYDGAHLYYLLRNLPAWDALQREHFTKFNQRIGWFNMVDLLAKLRRTTPDAAKKLYKGHLPEPLHIADHDSDEQAQAFFAALQHLEI